MPRNSKISSRIEEHFRNNPGRVVSVQTLMKVSGGNQKTVSGAISYLRAKNSEGKGGLAITTLTRGKSWAWYPKNEAVERQAVRAQKTVNPDPKWHEVPTAVSFQVVGTLADTGQIVLKGTSSGVEGVWLAKRIY